MYRHLTPNTIGEWWVLVGVLYKIRENNNNICIYYANMIYTPKKKPHYTHHSPVFTSPYKRNKNN